MSIAKLIERIIEKDNPTVAGLDPMPEYVPMAIRQKNFAQFGNTLKAEVESIRTFNYGLIDGLCDIVPAVKPQSAYYERLGPLGAALLYDTIEYAKKKNMYVILDIKRNDIGSTAGAYSDAYLGAVRVNDAVFEPYPADAITVNPYLGTDGIEPFLKNCREREKAIFVLVKTSNPSSGEFQNRSLEGAPLYEAIAKRLDEWGKTAMTNSGYSQAGAVVGATYPEEQRVLRALLPKAYFLVPGYGAQGASAEDIKNAFNSDGLGAIVNSSRGIMCAWKKTGNDGTDYIEAARQEALRMRDDLRRVVQSRKEAGV